MFRALKYGKVLTAMVSAPCRAHIKRRAAMDGRPPDERRRRPRRYLITSLSDDDVLATLFELPPKTAVIAWVPTARVDVV